MMVNAMIVDDSGIMRKLVMKSLRESKIADFIFIEANDGQDALEKFDPKATDMVFVDWNMPRMNGIDFVRKLRGGPKPAIPIVMITTEGTMDKVEEAMEQCAVDGYVVKPFTTEILQKKLEPVMTKVVEAAKKGQGGFFGKLAAKFA